VCYAIPGRVVALRDRLAVVEYYGRRKTARNEWPHLRVGDYVLAQGGFIIEILSEEEARETLHAWEALFRELAETDARLSPPALPRPGASPHIRRLLEPALEGRPLGLDAIEELLRIESPADLDLLYRTANHLRHRHQENACCVHGILELSNDCRRGCAYCGIHAGRRDLVRYRLSVEEAVEAAGEAIVRYGFRALVLQSGEGAYPLEDLMAIVAEIRRRWPCLVIASFGDMEEEALDELYTAGARGLLLRFETSNAALFARWRSGASLDRRLRLIRHAAERGYLLMTGALIGLPGQTLRDRARDILLARDLKPEMVSFGPFLPSPETPLSSATPPTLDDVLKTLAVLRLCDGGGGNVLVSTALETLHPDGRERGLQAGGNTLMLNATPLRYRPHYALYPGRAHASESLERQIADTLTLLKRLGRAPTDLGLSAAR